jgi:hypothetical protein
MRCVLLAGVVVFAQFAASAAYAALCTEPVPFTDIPSGAQATRDQMLSAQRGMKAYDIAVKAYTDCLHDAGESSDKINQAVDRLHKLADRFNDELHAFKQHNGAS